MRRRPLPRRLGAPGALYTALTLGLVVALASFALTARQTPPPTIAEFAPELDDPIPSPEALGQQAEQPAPVGQNRPGVLEGGTAPAPGAGPGEGPGEGGGGTTTAAPVTTTTTPVSQPDPVKGPPSSGSQRCIGTGPQNLSAPFRQTEDPRSPPCVISETVATAADSGARGVSPTHVNVAVFVPSGASMNEASRTVYEDLEEYFNRRYEFYGRRLNFVYPKTNSSGSDFGGANANEAGQIQQARDIADYVDAETGLGVFAAMNNGQTPSRHYDEQLARLGVVLVSNQERAALSSDAELRKLQWHYQPDFPMMGENLGRWLCSQFIAGERASNAGPVEAQKPRKFAYVLTRYPDGTTADTSGVDAELKRCGLVSPTSTVDRLELDYRNADPVTLQAATTGLNALRDKGVTSLICACKAASWHTMMMPAATNVGYFPEWITTNWGQNDVDRYSSRPPADQMAHAFGMTYNLEWVRESDLPIDVAIREVRPTFDWKLRGTFQDAYTWEAWRYPALLMAAAGIQAAGPNLTPETFRFALEGLAFPNPDRANDPLAARMRTPKVGFGIGDHVMSNDAVVTWWHDATSSNWDGIPGTWCYADGGQRFSFTTWRKVRLFSGPCRS